MRVINQVTCLNGARLTLENCQVGLRVRRMQPRFGGWPLNYPVLHGGSVVNYKALSDAGYHHRYLTAPNCGESDHGVVEQLNRVSGYLAVRWWKVRHFSCPHPAEINEERIQSRFRVHSFELLIRSSTKIMCLTHWDLTLLRKCKQMW